MPGSAPRASTCGRTSSTTNGGSCATAPERACAGACERKQACTDSDSGREIVRPVDPWPHSEAGRFHRGLSLVLVVLAGLILVVELTRHHRPAEALALVGALAVVALAAGFLARDFLAHPSGFPASFPPGR